MDGLYADLILENANIATLDEEESFVSASAARDGRIVATGAQRSMQAFEGRSCAPATPPSPNVMSLITFDAKCAGAGSAGNPHAACDVAGTGNGATDDPGRARRGKPRTQTRDNPCERPRQLSTLPGHCPTFGDRTLSFPCASWERSGREASRNHYGDSYGCFTSCDQP
jgi:hypothetical protein